MPGILSYSLDYTSQAVSSSLILRVLILPSNHNVLRHATVVQPDDFEPNHGNFTLVSLSIIVQGSTV